MVGRMREGEFGGRLCILFWGKGVLENCCSLETAWDLRLDREKQERERKVKSHQVTKEVQHYHWEAAKQPNLKSSYLKLHKKTKHTGFVPLNP